MNDIMKTVQALEDSNILLKGVTKTTINETKEQKRDFLSMILGILGASLFGNLLTGKGTIRAGEGIARAGYGFSIKKKALIPPHSNFEIKDYYENEPRFNGVYYRDNLTKTIKNGAYVINLDLKSWITLYAKNNEVIYFDSFGVEHVPKEIERFIGRKNTKTNMFRIQAGNSVMCGCSCIGFIDFMFKNKSLIDFTGLFFPYDCKKKKL